MSSGVDLKLWIRILRAETLTGGLCLGVSCCVLGRVCHFLIFFLGRRRVSFFLLLRQSMLRWPRGSRRPFFLRYIWSFIFPDRDVGCTLVKENNVGAIHLAKNPATTPNSKHIDIRHHCTRERVANGEFKIAYVASEEQHANFLTKPLHQGAFEVHRNFVMNIR